MSTIEAATTLVHLSRPLQPWDDDVDVDMDVGTIKLKGRTARQLTQISSSLLLIILHVVLASSREHLVSSLSPLLTQTLKTEKESGHLVWMQSPPNPSTREVDRKARWHVNCVSESHVPSRWVIAKGKKNRHDGVKATVNSNSTLPSTTTIRLVVPSSSTSLNAQADPDSMPIQATGSGRTSSKRKRSTTSSSTNLPISSSQDDNNVPSLLQIPTPTPIPSPSHYHHSHSLSPTSPVSVPVPVPVLATKPPSALSLEPISPQFQYVIKPGALRPYSIKSIVSSDSHTSTGEFIMRHISRIPFLLRRIKIITTGVLVVLGAGKRDKTKDEFKVPEYMFE
ncbi:hypothetical protein TREMEDRAFT_66271 [Tremella mesenterica DSM 1558]|uniref:uncharacterized protein n=1 Tax=Tremella mesenterica (strain ATCC 24925 / CBS 8224 / DSM 1558 / NBRC 9311 / NRRL Y-6157 / RJB 2259-6 / UBC 559-6) TaxID=578456 RepID=UPI00032CD1EE|nr:uncharacterized protein TREMEDRAFT_66271 [Tremella mesenterica DSM 1558]EIW65677.1 hypothetical protein TREMEDRAFT_66271 [Tremella mesenterica DSM 1558]